MRIEPKDFQDDAVLRLIEEIESARREIDRGRLQAVVLSSPTGSGKTVIMTLLMERLWAGHESIVPDPNAIFLWISDSPELNIQSKEKIEAASDIFPRSRLVVIENDFKQERLAPGHIYFLNTQKLGVSSLLTKPADQRTWTIWQTIENTAKTSPTHFNVIVDEAHRGMGLSAKTENNRRTLIQRFIKGAPEVGLSPIPLVIGKSATPERFHKVLEGAQRITRPVEVKAEDVRESGLIKDRIVLDLADDDARRSTRRLDPFARCGAAGHPVREGMEAVLRGPGDHPAGRACAGCPGRGWHPNDTDPDGSVQGRRCVGKSVRAFQRGRVGPLLPRRTRHHGRVLHPQDRRLENSGRRDGAGGFSSRWHSPRAGTARAPR